MNTSICACRTGCVPCIWILLLLAGNYNFHFCETVLRFSVAIASYLCWYLIVHLKVWHTARNSKCAYAWTLTSIYSLLFILLWEINRWIFNWVFRKSSPYMYPPVCMDLLGLRRVNLISVIICKLPNVFN